MLISRLSLGTKVFLISAFVMLLTSLGDGLILYRGAIRSLREEVRSKLICSARIAALQIDADLHRQVRLSADETTPACKKLKAKLVSILKSSPDMRYVYTISKTGKKGVLQFVVDGETNPELTSHIGDVYDTRISSEMLKGFNEATADKKQTSDKWGDLLSGYAPIKDANGRTEAIIGMDMSIAQLKKEERSLSVVAVKTGTAAFMLSILLSLAVTRSVLKHVKVFTKATERIEGGDLDFQIDVGASDEIGQFRRAFNRMIKSLKENHGRLLEQSTRDFLTGLFNHGYFHERLADEIERAKRYDRNLCLLILDIDKFKAINDTYSHPVGDGILRQVALLLKENIRSIDIAARYGGDEFAVILPEADIDQGLETAERVRALIEEHDFFLKSQRYSFIEDCASSRVSKLTVTIGLAGYPRHHHSKEGLMMAADIALCRAKHMSRNSVCVYDSSICSEQNVDPQALYQMLRDPSAAAIQSLAAAVDAKDRYTHGHSERVTEYASMVSKELSMDDDQIEAVKVASLLHDLGKIGIPDSILNKHGSLTEEERQTIQLHPSIAENILRRAPQLDLIVPAVLFHHERWDGGGYPDGLKGDEIPLMARILAIADSYDAMTSDRPYRKALSHEDALLEIAANAGKQFDPDLTQVFISAMSANTGNMKAA
ncbi:MAG: diguanylate cyclase [Armatimonadota bacterium]